MRKLFLLLVAIFLMASSAYAMVETAENGPQLITNCYVKGTAALTSGSVVVLQTSSPTYYGKEVTGTTTAGMPIYGVVVDSTNYNTIEMITPRWVRVQTYGYVSNVRLANIGAVTANSAICTSGELFKATGCLELGPVSTATRVTTGNTVALESNSSLDVSGNETFKAFLK